MSVITFTCHPPAPATPLPSRPQPQANAKTSLLAVTISLILGFPPSRTFLFSLYLPWLVGRDHEGALDRQDVLHCTARRRPDASCLRITRNASIFVGQTAFNGSIFISLLLVVRNRGPGEDFPCVFAIFGSLTMVFYC
jgi:hypothetical protein